MKQLFILTSLLLVNFAEAQNFWNKLYDAGCPIPDSTRTVFTEFHPLSLELPIGWEGEFEGELPVLKVKKEINNKSYRLRLSSAYDASEIFDWAQEHFDPNSFEIITFRERKILIEHPTDRTTYMLSFYHDPNSDNLWVWRLQIGGALGNEEQVKCDLSFLLEQLIKE